MSRPVSSTPYLPNAGRANDIWQLNAFDQDLNKALFSYLSELARRVNGSLPKDGSEAVEGDMDFGGFDILNVAGVQVSTPDGIYRNITNGVLQLSGGTVGTGANIELYGGTHAGVPEDAFYDARMHTFRQMNGTLNTVTSRGVTFPATQIASVGANTFDDYEEGTWTPTVTFGGGSSGITYTTQRGNYLKIGKFVFLDYEILLSSKGVSTGTTLVGGMPFSTATTRPGNGPVGFYSGMAFPAGTVGNSTLSYGGTDFNVRYHSNTTTTASNDTHWTNTSRLIGAFTYQAAD